MANTSVALYQRIKIKKQWIDRKALGELSKLATGNYHVSWYDGVGKRMDPAGNDPEVALKALNKKHLELAYVRAGGEIKRDKNLPSGTSQRIRVRDAVCEYLADCRVLSRKMLVPFG